MGTLPNSADTPYTTRRSPEQVIEISRRREVALSRLLVMFIASGLTFMLLPGTFLGVWNLFSISGREAANSVSPAWIQAHGHAQIFGWVISFILGIGFYSIPKLRRGNPLAMGLARACWALWTAGVALRWFANVYQWHWRVLLPLSAALELIAFVLFFQSVAGHRPPSTGDSAQRRFEPWALMVISTTVAVLLMLVANLAECVYLALYAAGPAFTPVFDQRFLILAAWGCLVPFVWGFSAKWLPIFLGLKPTRTRLLLAAFILNGLGVIAALAGRIHLAAVLLLHGAIFAPSALRVFARSERPAKTAGVHASFNWFTRLAYVWLRIAATLGVWASVNDSPGIWGASRHALTAGFLALMIFAIGQRILPAFSGMRLLYSARLMFASMALLSTGCLLRVTAEILAYQGYAAWAWSWLPVSAVIELTAVTLFAVNLVCTYKLQPAPPVASVSLVPDRA